MGSLIPYTRDKAKNNYSSLCRIVGNLSKKLYILFMALFVVCCSISHFDLQFLPSPFPQTKNLICSVYVYFVFGDVCSGGFSFRKFTMRYQFKFLIYTYWLASMNPYIMFSFSALYSYVHVLHLIQKSITRAWIDFTMLHEPFQSFYCYNAGIAFNSISETMQYCNVYSRFRLYNSHNP